MIQILMCFYVVMSLPCLRKGQGFTSQNKVKFKINTWGHNISVGKVLA